MRCLADDANEINVLFLFCISTRRYISASSRTRAAQYVVHSRPVLLTDILRWGETQNEEADAIYSPRPDTWTSLCVDVGSMCARLGRS